MPEPQVYPTAYAVSCLPPDHEDAYHLTIHVEWRGPGDRWAVMRNGYCYSKTGRQRYERNPSSRTDAFKRTYRHSLENGLALAKKLAPTLTVGGLTVDQVIAQRAQWDPTEAPD